MQLPFTHEQFLDVFATYNRLFWPVALLLWVGTAVTLVAWWRNGSASSPALAALLALQWAWSGIAYHFALFRAVNPAATGFAALFVVQAVLLVWLGVVRRRLVFTPSNSGWGAVAVAFVVFAMAYPVLGLVTGLSYPRVPTFGVPCPTTLLTVGLLLTASRPEARLAAPIPLLWSAIGGSAALALAITPDFALPVGLILLLIRLFQPASLKVPQHAS